MKPAVFKYHDPRSLGDALGLIGALEDTRVLAGGQSLMPMMNFRFLQPGHLIDLNGIDELAGISFRNGSLRFGAMTRQREIEFSKEITQHCPILQEALSHVGHRQTRNRGTIGGSLCHLDPSAELVNCISVHDGAIIHVQSRQGSRDLSLTEFCAGFMAHNLAEGEMVVGVTLPLWSRSHGYAFVEVARRRGDFAIAAVAALIELDNDAKISRVAISIAGVLPNPVRATAAERQLLGQEPNAQNFADAAALLQFDDALTDAYVTAEYRIHLAGVLTRRGLEAAARKARERAAHA